MKTATYSPEDNKLRLYSAGRLDEAEFARVKAHGFKWAPRQELFVAPMWTPEREDLLLELCGEIGDEDTSLVDRAEERAERFEWYSESRAADAESARKTVASIADNIPFGQPILVGHHSEKHARRDAERIENGMRRAVKAWETAKYWTQRAAGAVAAAKYKERPDVRARRIKGIEADKRKMERNLSHAKTALAIWSRDLTEAQAIHYAGSTPYGDFTLPRKDGDRQDWNHRPNAYAALSNSYPNLYAPRTVQEVSEAARAAYPIQIAWAERWIAHYDNRLAYERAMLAADGGTVADKTGPEVGGGCKCWASRRGAYSWIQKVNRVSVTVLDNWGNGGGNFTRTIPFDKLRAVVSKADVDAARAEGRLFDTADKTGFVLADSAPAPAPEPEPKTERKGCDSFVPLVNGGDYRGTICTACGEAENKHPNSEKRSEFEAMRESLRNGVRVVVVKCLFPTPPELAARMVELAGIQPGDRVLEPSAGTGSILGAMGGQMFGHHPERGGVVAVEINGELCEHLGREFPLTKVHRADFLACNGNLGDLFDRIVMNPPFDHGADIQHIKHAAGFLRPGGKLVALCADGPRQRAELQPMAIHWEKLPAGTFSDQGTAVNVALLVIQN